MEVQFASQYNIGYSRELTLDYYSYNKSLVGRDYKAWAQVGIFIVWELLTSSEKIIWLSLAKVNHLVHT